MTIVVRRSQRDGFEDLKPLRVFISTSSFGKVDTKPLELLRNENLVVQTNPFGRPLTIEEATELLRDVDGLIAGTEPLTREVLSAATRLKVISRCGVGLDNVDLKAAAELGITVTNTTRAHVAAVAELTIGAMIALLRHIPQNDRAVRQGTWSKEIGQLLQGRTIGIIGLGNVGKAVIRALRHFEASVLAYDTRPDTAFAEAHGVRLTPIDRLLQEAELVSLHLPYHPDIHHFLDRERLARMKPDAYLVNTSRGGLVDEGALYEALLTGRLAGAFVDTFEREPYRGPLTQLPNVILSPHVGAYAKESRLAMEMEAAQNLIHHLRSSTIYAR